MGTYHLIFTKENQHLVCKQKPRNMIKKVRIPIVISALSLMLFSCGSSEQKVEKAEETALEIEEVEEEISDDAIEVQEGETPLEALLSKGKFVYQAQCQVCHRVDGKGIEGKIPPLAESEFLNNHIEKGIDIVLNGLEGEIEVNGQKYDSRMPKLDLSEEEVASVLSYVLNKWGNSGDVITKYEVRDVSYRVNPMISTEQLVEMMDAGKAIYTEKCRLCHLEDGSGQEGITPPLNNSSFLLSNIDKGIEFVTRGFSGEIEVNGKKYNGTMPPQNLTDKEVAEVFTYILNSWDNPGIAITQEDVRTAIDNLPEVEKEEPKEL